MEEKGFEPPDPFRSSDFESDAIDRSATLPFKKFFINFMK